MHLVDVLVELSLSGWGGGLQNSENPPGYGLDFSCNILCIVRVYKGKRVFLLADSVLPAASAGTLLTPLNELLEIIMELMLHINNPSHPKWLHALMSRSEEELSPVPPRPCNIQRLSWSVTRGQREEEEEEEVGVISNR